MSAQGKWAAPKTVGQCDLVLLCGGTEGQRDEVRAGNSDLINGSDPVVASDVQSLLRYAPQSRAVIVCGELAGMSVPMVERLLRQHAPQAGLIRADRASERTGPARRRARRRVLARLTRLASIPR